jgi:hypothetical protein
MKHKKKKPSVKTIHTGEKAVAHHVDLSLGKFLVIEYVEFDEFEVYWRNDIVMVAKHTEEYNLAFEAVLEKYERDAYGSCETYY